MITSYPSQYIWGAGSTEPDVVTNAKLNNNQARLEARLGYEAALGAQFAVNPGTTSGLTLGYRGGIVGTEAAPVPVAAGQVGLLPGATNYVQVSRLSGAVSAAASLSGEEFIPLHRVETDSGGITAWQDLRSWTFKGETGAAGPAGDPGPPGADGADGADGVGVPEGGTAGQVLAKVSGTDFHTQWASPGAAAGDAAGSGLTLAGPALLGRSGAGSGALEAVTAGAAFTLEAGVLGLANSGIVAGEYERLTVDAKGRATAGGKGAFAPDAAATAGLTLGYFGGRVGQDDGSSSTVNSIPAGTVALADDATNFVEATPSGSALVSNTTGWTSGHFPVYEVVTAAGAIVSVTAQFRTYTRYSGGGAGSSAFTGLEDVPASYSGQAQKTLAVKGDESGLEFVTLPPALSSATTAQAIGGTDHSRFMTPLRVAEAIAALTATGIVAMERCELYRTANYTLAHDVFTDVPFTHESFDTDHLHEAVTHPERITVPASGLYLLTARVRFAGNNEGDRYAAFCKNGAQYLAIHSQRPLNNSGAGTYINLATVAQLEAEDYITLRTCQTSGADLDLLHNSGSIEPFFTLVHLSSAPGGGARVLTLPRTYYVRPDGSDSNEGLANTSGGAFLTIQKAVDVASGFLLAGANITIQLADGSYEGANLKPVDGSGRIIIQGNPTDATAVQVSTGTRDAVFWSRNVGGTYQLGYMGLSTTANKSCLLAIGSGTIVMDNLDFGEVDAGCHIVAEARGMVTTEGNDYTISGGAAVHYLAYDQSLVVVQGSAVSLVGTPHFTTAFAYIYNLAELRAPQGATVFTGGATGKRYNVFRNGIINVNNGSSSYLPGNSSGEQDSGGLYF